MKKILLFSIGFLICTGFIHDNLTLKSTAKNIVKENMCVKIDAYKLLTNNSQRAEWLRINKNNLCAGEDLSKFVFEEHLIEKSDFDLRAKNKTVTKLSWVNDIQPIIRNIKDYDQYVSFDIDSQNKITLKVINNFQEKPSCYSTVCFKSAFENAKSRVTNINNIMFNFVVVNKDEVIFEVIEEDSNQTFLNRISQHNISDKPMKDLGDLMIFKSNKGLKKVNINDLKKMLKAQKMHNKISSPL